VSVKSLPAPLATTGRNSPWICAAFFSLAAAGIGFFFVPAFIILPFRYQSPHALWIALYLRQRAPLVTLICAAACLLLGALLWSAATRWRKSLLALVLVLVAFSAAMARMNYFEWMFHPIEGAQFMAQSESKLEGKEMIMAVRLNNDARAYPISQMAYHHVLNDFVGGVPIVVTY